MRVVEKSSRQPRQGADERTGDVVKRPTIADIARQAGLTKAAVSFALNGQPGVSDQTRSRVLDIARRIG